MSDAQQKSWSDNPNAPKIPYGLYFLEKAYFGGVLFGLILYGTLIVLFFQCMTALLDSANRKKDGIKWGLASYTLVMFSVVTVVTAQNAHVQSLAYIDYRESPDGPLGYQTIVDNNALSITTNLMSLLNYWLADALLLHRCYAIYARNLWVIAFPCLMYLATVATGIMILIAQANVGELIGISLRHLSITVSLNILLTLMIVTRIILHGRNIRATTASRAGISGLYKTIVTMFIESSALYTVTSLLLIALWAAGSGGSGIFLPIHAETQVIAPLLIIQRVANRSALTSNTIFTAQIDSFRARSRGESAGGSRDIPSGYPMRSADSHGKNTGELEIMTENRVNPQGSGV